MVWLLSERVVLVVWKPLLVRTGVRGEEEQETISKCIRWFGNPSRVDRVYPYKGGTGTFPFDFSLWICRHALGTESHVSGSRSNEGKKKETSPNSLYLFGSKNNRGEIKRKFFIPRKILRTMNKSNQTEDILLFYVIQQDKGNNKLIIVRNLKYTVKDP